MAGRPVTVRGGGLTGLHYGLITFVIIAVASLGGFIFQLTKVKDAEQRAANAERRLSKLGQPPAPVGSYYESEASARNTPVLAVMGGDLARMAELIAGTKEAVGATLEAEANDMLARIAASKPGVLKPSDSLFTAIRSLDARLTEALSTNKALMDELAAKTQAVESLTQQLKSASDTFGHQVDALKTQEQQTADEFGRKLTDKETQLSDLQSTLESREQQLQELKRGGEQERREFQVEVERRTRQIADLQKSIQTLKGSFDPEAILKKADGRVLRAIPGSDIVYVNLGSANNIKVGMGFEVFPKLTMAGPLRGKASLEVVTLMENSAECRVTRTTPGQPIVEGDIVVNIAFEQNRKPKFVVRGEFDLNFDGQIDFDGADRIAAIIRQWGGQVVPELDESVDYVVVGVPPREGEVPRDASDVVRDQIERKRLERSEFRKLIDEARSMYIPVITQNQFLFLTGYAGNTDVISQ